MLTDREGAATRPVPRDDEVVAQPELSENPVEERPEASYEVHLLDYVMHDFGFPKRSRSYR